MRTPLIIVGTSGHAAVVVDAIERGGSREIVAFVDSARSPGDSAFGYPVIGPEDRLPAFLLDHGACEAVVAIGDNFQRRRMAARLRALVPGLRLATVVHPAACVSPRAMLGDGVVILAGAIVCAGARVGDGAVLNTGCSLDHDSAMAPWSSLGPRAVTGGRVRIGECGSVAIGATVLQGRTVGCHAIVGAGAVATRDTADHAVAVGVPARVVRRRCEDEPAP